MRHVVLKMAFLVYITLPESLDPVEFCSRLVEEGLAAGMNILGPCKSVFRWEGKIRKEREWIAIGEVSEDLFDRFCERTMQIHPYKIPCVTALRIEKGYEPFIDWINQTGGMD